MGSFYVHESSYIDENVEIGDNTKIWHFSHVQAFSRIGDNCTIGQNVNIGPRVRVGNFCKIQNNVSVFEGVEMEDYVFCGPSMTFTNVSTPRCKYPRRDSRHYQRTLVKFGASIGANATILCGNTIGRHALIGAGAVVTHDVADYAVVIGVPARQTGWACECGELLPSIETAAGEAACSNCSRQYRLSAGKLAVSEPPASKAAAAR